MKVAALFVAVLCYLGPTLSARAHPGHAGSERLIKLDLASAPARIAYGLVLSVQDAAPLRQRADQNGDGQVSEAEGGALQEALTRELLANLRLCQGPDPSAMSCASAESSQVLSAVATGWPKPEAALALSWEVQLELAENSAAMRVEDAWNLVEVGSTSGQIEPNPEHVLARAGAEGTGQSEPVALEVLWPGSSVADAGAPIRPPVARVLFAVWVAPSIFGSSLSGPWWLLGGLAFGGGVATALFMNRRRDPKTP
ncbi:MAG: hypothetical protein QM778_12365 [Myxococcales bacterium]